MSNTPNEFIDHGDRPTEELYIELRDLEAMETRTVAESHLTAASGAEEDDTSGIRERIAHLRSLLSDRGVIQD